MFSGRCSSAISSSMARASPELVPLAASPLIVDELYMLNLLIVPGPVVKCVVPRALTGIIVPPELFMKNRFKLSVWARYGASAWM